MDSDKIIQELNQRFAAPLPKYLCLALISALHQRMQGLE